MSDLNAGMKGESTSGLTRRDRIGRYMLGLVIAAGAVLLTPSPSGWQLLRSVDSVKQMMETSSIAPKELAASVTFVPSRYSLARIIGSRYAAWSLKKGDGGDLTPDVLSALIEGHGPNAVHALDLGAFVGCRVIASAQAFDAPDSSVHRLGQLIEDRRLAWEYVLLHEVAHCFWNGGLEMEDRVRDAAQQFRRTYNPDDLRVLAARNMSEGYADAYAILALDARAPRQASEVARSVRTWRAEKMAKGRPHRTHGAIDTVLASIESGAPRNDFDSVHRIAISAAIAGTAQWLTEQALDPARIEALLTELAGLQGVGYTASSVKDGPDGAPARFVLTPAQSAPMAPQPAP